MIVELAIKLDKDLEYYQQILQNANAINNFNCTTHDVYFTNSNLENMTEEEMKNSCIRFRSVKEAGSNKWSYSIQNFQLFFVNLRKNYNYNKTEISYLQNILYDNNWMKIFDTLKRDYQYSIGNMKSRIQLQEIDDIGLVLYYDNPNFYHLEEKEQRKKLIDELNSYGFSINYDDKDIDKLRTLFFKKECYKQS